VGDVMRDGSLYTGYHGPAILLAIVSVVVGAGGLLLAWWMYGSGDLSRSRKLSKGGLQPFWNVSWNGWWWDDVYNAFFVGGAMRLYSAVLWFDKTVIDGIVNGVGHGATKISDEFRRLQNGQVQVYGLVMFIGVCLFLLYFALGLATFLGDKPEPVPPPHATTTNTTGHTPAAELSLAGDTPARQ
jgi:NADH-quinone oxidoreductase subunit L